MKILSHGKTTKAREVRLYGSCKDCKCRVSCSEDEVDVLVDGGPTDGTRYVHCPECDNPYLWVK